MGLVANMSVSGRRGRSGGRKGEGKAPPWSAVKTRPLLSGGRTEFTWCAYAQPRGHTSTLAIKIFWPASFRVLICLRSPVTRSQNMKTHARGFRLWEQNAERLEYAQKIGLNPSELVNRLLEEHLKPLLERERSVREKELRAVLSAPVP
jgi:hypothetical protein